MLHQKGTVSKQHCYYIFQSLDSSHANLQTDSGVAEKHTELCFVSRVDLVAGKEKHVVSELPQGLSVNRGNGKIDMVALIDGLDSAYVLVATAT